MGNLAVKASSHSAPDTQAYASWVASRTSPSRRYACVSQRGASSSRTPALMKNDRRQTPAGFNRFAATSCMALMPTL